LKLDMISSSTVFGGWKLSVEKWPRVTHVRIDFFKFRLLGWYAYPMLKAVGSGRKRALPSGHFVTALPLNLSVIALSFANFVTFMWRVPRSIAVLGFAARSPCSKPWRNKTGSARAIATLTPLPCAMGFSSGILWPVMGKMSEVDNEELMSSSIVNGCGATPPIGPATECLMFGRIISVVDRLFGSRSLMKDRRDVGFLRTGSVALPGAHDSGLVGVGFLTGSGAGVVFRLLGPGGEAIKKRKNLFALSFDPASFPKKMDTVLRVLAALEGASAATRAMWIR
jgi:hypothetical protein